MVLLLLVFVSLLGWCSELLNDFCIALMHFVSRVFDEYWTRAKKTNVNDSARIFKPLTDKQGRY